MHLDDKTAIPLELDVTDQVDRALAALGAALLLGVLLLAAEDGEALQEAAKGGRVGKSSGQ
jgi:hypothetical protein